MNSLQHLYALLNSGGPLMWIILAAAAIAFTLISRLFLLVYSQQRMTARDYGRLSVMRFSPDYLSRYRLPANLATQLKDENTIDRQTFTREIMRHQHEHQSRLEAALSTIAVIGSLLPMLGLLGTVTGMINVFEVIAIHGSGKPDAMAGGISQALLTTASGLIFSIPVIFLHHVLVQRANRLLDLNGQTTQLMLEKYQSNVDLTQVTGR